MRADFDWGSSQTPRLRENESEAVATASQSNRFLEPESQSDGRLKEMSNSVIPKVPNNIEVRTAIHKASVLSAKEHPRGQI